MTYFQCAYCPFTETDEDAMLDHVLGQHASSDQEEDWSEEEGEQP